MKYVNLNLAEKKEKELINAGERMFLITLTLMQK